MATRGKRWSPSIRAGEIKPGPQFWNPWPDQPARAQVNLPVKGDEHDKTTPEKMTKGAGARSATHTGASWSKKGRPL